MAEPVSSKHVENHLRGQELPWGERRQLCVQVQRWGRKAGSSLGLRARPSCSPSFYLKWLFCMIPCISSLILKSLEPLSSFSGKDGTLDLRLYTQHRIINSIDVTLSNLIIDGDHRQDMFNAIH